MPTNFDEIIDRRGTASIKYDFAAERGYPSGVLPFWVADMDFRAPAPLLDALTRRTGLDSRLLRLSVGIEDVDDIEEDLAQALRAAARER